MKIAALLLPLIAASSLSAATTLAVLPLANQDEAPSFNWIGESVAETVRESLLGASFLTLSREEREVVYRRLSVREGVPLTKATVMKIAGSLDAGVVVYGSFRVETRAGGKPDMSAPLRLTLRTIDLKKLQPGRDLEQTGSLGELSTMQSHLAWMLLKQLAPGSTPPEDDYLRLHAAVRLDAMESYVRGLMAPAPQLREKLFGQAVKIDERFSQAQFQLGRALFEKKNYKHSAEALQRVARSDFHFMEASFLLAICRIQEKDPESAVQLLRMVSNDFPLNEVYNNLGVALSRRNDSGAGAAFQKAIEGDQSDPDYWFNSGYTLWKYGQFAAAADKFRAVLDRASGDSEATIMLGRCLRNDGPHGNEARANGRERIKTRFEDSAFRQLQAELRRDTADRED